MKLPQISKKIKSCRASGEKKLKVVGKFPKMSLTGVFPKTQRKIIETPVEVVFAKKSKLLQLRHNYNSKYLYGKNYGYRSGLNPIMIKHLKEKYQKIKKNLKIKKSDKILDIGSNDGTFLNFFNCDRSGIDPSLEKLSKYYNKNIKKIPYTFETGYKKIKSNKYKLISAIAMFYDIKKPVSFLKKISSILDDNGIFHVEVAYLPKIIDDFSYDTFCQEHYEYYSIMSLNFITKKAKMNIIDFGFNNINGGSIWLNIGKKVANAKQKLKLNQLTTKEREKKIHKEITYIKYFKKVFDHANKINKIIKSYNQKNIDVYGYGASTKGNVLLQTAKLSNTKIKAIFDVNKEKFNCYTPKTNIKILDEKKLKKIKPAILLILIWHFKDFIIKKIKRQSPKTKLLIPFPKIKII